MLEKEKFWLGVDGCKEGWIVFKIIKNLEYKIEIFRSIKELIDQNPHFDLMLIDIPIGLRTRNTRPRLCDTAARKYIGKRSSSIFPTPSRAVLKASNYQEANLLNKKMTTHGLSKQTWYITAKIKQMDNFLKTNSSYINRIIECHPEVCFTSLNHNSPMKYYKKSEKGIKERLLLLRNLELFEVDPISYAKNNLDFTKSLLDDVIDAWILAVSALGGVDRLEMIPKNFEYDSMGLPMRIAKPLFRRE